MMFRLWRIYLGLAAVTPLFQQYVNECARFFSVAPQYTIRSAAHVQCKHCIGLVWSALCVQARLPFSYRYVTQQHAVCIMQSIVVLDRSAVIAYAVSCVLV